MTVYCATREIFNETYLNGGPPSNHGGGDEEARGSNGGDLKSGALGASWSANGMIEMGAMLLEKI